MAKPKERTFFLPSYGTLSETDNNNNDNDNIMEEEEQGIMLPLNYPGSSASSTIASTESESSFLIPITGVGAGDASLFNINEDQNNNKARVCKNGNQMGHHQSSKERNSAAADLRLSMLSNFSTAYNVLSISLALDILSNLHVNEVTIADKSLCSSALFAGMIVGQLAGGALGDILGRHLAMTVVMLLQVCASLLSSFSTDVHWHAWFGNTTNNDMLSLNIFHVLAFWRFMLGLGCGGVYPLAATLTAESSSNNNNNNDDQTTSNNATELENEKGRRVAMAFSFQGVGYLVVPLVAYALVGLLGESSDLAWRLLLALGATPGIVLTISRVRNNVQRKKTVPPPSTTAMTQQLATQAQRSSSIWEAIRQEPELWRKFLGTGGCWLLFDILFYGNTLFQPIVLACAFGTQEETVQKVARDSAMIASLALPGYFMSVLMIGRQSPRYIQLQGFAVMAALYACIALFFDQMSGNRYLLLGVYGSTFFFSNYGPNATTFMLPAMTFTKRCRSTLNGVCAACGKVGALVGSMVFVQAVRNYGQNVVFGSCSVLSLVGFVVTMLCVAPPSSPLPQEEILAALEQGTIPVDSAMVAKKRETPARIPSVFSMPSIFDFHEDFASTS